MSLIPQHNRKAEALQIHNAELLLKCEKLEQELATLRAKAEAYDKGLEMWAVFTNFGFMTAIADNEWQAKRKAETHSPYSWSEAEMMGYTCRKVRVCEVVG